MAEKINVRGVMFDNVSLNETVDTLFDRLSENKQTALFTPNSEIVQACIEDNSLYPVINSGDLVVPDGIGVIKAARILGTPFKSGKVAGIEVGEALLSKLSTTEKTVYFLGGKPGIAEQASSVLTQKYPGLKIIGCHDGYFSKKGKENDDVIEIINASRPDVLFVCLGAPAQEKWIAEFRSKLPEVSLFLGLGGSLDGYAGSVKRAPTLFIKLGLEWLWRLIKEPWRFKRMLKLPKFYFGTIWFKLFTKHAKNV